MSGAAISVDALSKRYGRRTVVDRVSLEVRAGEVVALLGPNGAGKTTTVEVIEGYRRADGGSVKVLGIDPWGAGRSHRARVGLMLQGGGIDLRARPAETLRQYAAFHADPLDPASLIDELGLGAVATSSVRRLSGGERQRLAFALALVGRPDVLVLDEPTSGLDVEARLLVRSRIEAERARGAAVLVTTHDVADAERIADRIAILVRGRVLADGSVSELAAGLARRLRFALDTPLDDGAVASLGRALGATLRPTTGAGARYEVDGAAPSPALIAALAAWCATADHVITDMRAAGGSLEEAYLELVAESDSADGAP